MPLDSARAEEEPGTDLRIRQAVASEARDLLLLRGENIARRDRPLGNLGPCREQLPPGPFGESLHPDRCELLVRGAKLDACIAPAILAAQPLPVEQMGPCELRTPPGPCQSFDCLPMQAVGVLTLAQEGPAARFHAPAPVRVGRRGG